MNFTGRGGCDMSSLDDKSLEDGLKRLTELKTVTSYGNINKVIYGDCLKVLKGLPPASVDLIYIDPPFFTQKKRKTTKFEYSDDAYECKSQYLVWLADVLCELKNVLKVTGSIYIHLDHHIVYEAKGYMDTIFGENNFLNDIIWHYKGGGVSKRRFARKHDTILWYAYDSSQHYFNPDPIRVPYTDGTVARMKNKWKRSNTKLDYGHYKLNPLGKHPDDVIIHKTIPEADPESTGYPSQKPMGLISKFIESSSKEGDVVLDCFAGSGTVGAVCKQLKRKYILIDNSSSAMNVMIERGFHID